MARAGGKSGRVSVPNSKGDRPVSLNDLADYLGLAPATVSLVMNRSAVSETIAKETKRRIFEAANKLGYRPNFLARCLRARRSFTIGVLTPEVSTGYNATVLAGIEDHLLQEGYFYFVASHRFQKNLINRYPELFLSRSVDGLIVLSAPWEEELAIPVVTISCPNSVPGTTRLALDHRRSVDLAFQHLWQLGHEEIAVIKGQAFAPDSELRWNAIVEVTRAASRVIDPSHVVQIEDNLTTPELGYRVTQELMSMKRSFTALFAFNDISAIGAIRALREHGLRVPEDVSVIGFNDIESAAYQNPGLTTVRQPLQQMGKTAAEIVLRRIRGTCDAGGEVVFQPELIVRGTTAPVTGKRSSMRRTSLSPGK